MPTLFYSGVSRIEKQCCVSFKKDDGAELVMYGEIINHKVLKDSIAPVYHHKSDFQALDESTQKEIIEDTYKELHTLIYSIHGD